jgi:cytochrome P450
MNNIAIVSLSLSSLSFFLSGLFIFKTFYPVIDTLPFFSLLSPSSSFSNDTFSNDTDVDVDQPTIHKMSTLTITAISLSTLLLLPPLLVFFHLLSIYFTSKTYYPVVKGRHFLMGHLPLIGGSSNFYNWLCECADENCPKPLPGSPPQPIASRPPTGQGMFEFFFPGTDRHYLVLTNFAAIESLFKHRPFKVERNKQVQVIEEIGPGVFSAEGDVWRKDRRIVAPAFNHSNINLYLGHVHTTAARLANKWGAACSRTNAEAGVGGGAATLAINDDLMKHSSDTTALAAFAFDFNSLENEECIEASDLAKAFAVIRVRGFAMIKYWRIPVLRNFVPAYRREVALIERLNSLLGKIVDDFEDGQRKRGSSCEAATDRTRATASSESARESTILSKMLKVNQGEPERMTKERLIGNMATLFVAGTDTTSITIMWMLYYLSLDVELQDRCREEAEKVDFAILAEEGPPQLKLSDLNASLPNLHSVFLEVLRVRAPFASMTYWNPTEEIEILGKVWKPKERQFVCMLGYAQTSGEGAEERFGPNPTEFIPSRWVEDGVVPTNAASKLLAFGGGHRICPGRDLARAEAFVCVGMLLQKFKGMRLEEGHEKVGTVQSVSSSPSCDIRIVFDLKEEKEKEKEKMI